MKKRKNGWRNIQERFRQNEQRGDPTHHRKVKRKRISYQYPSRKAMKKMKAEIKRNVNNRSLLVAKEEDLIKNLNPKITGWKNYYSTKTNEKWMQALVHRIISN